MCGSLLDGFDSRALAMSGSAYLYVSVPFGISIQEKPQQLQAFHVALSDCAVVFNLGTFYLRDIRRGFASVLLLQSLGTHHISCILVFSQSYIRTQISRVYKRGILISILNTLTFVAILCSGHLFTEICNLRFAFCVTTRFIVLFLFTLGLIQLGENKEPTNCLAK